MKPKVIRAWALISPRSGKIISLDRGMCVFESRGHAIEQTMPCHREYLVPIRINYIPKPSRRPIER